MRASAHILALSAAMTAVLTTVLTAGPSVAGALERVHLKFDAATGERASGTELVVSGAAGRYDRLETAAVTANLALFAELTPDASEFRVITSGLFLKSEGYGASNAGSAQAVDALGGGSPVSRIDDRRAFVFGVSTVGPVAQAALAACNNLAATERRQLRKLILNLAVVWRVTTGRFNFKWTNYDRVAPSDDIVNNREFYSEQATQDAETVIETAVACQPLDAEPQVAAGTPQQAKPDAVKKVTFTPIEPAAASSKPATALAAISTASVSDKTKPVCEGGMVRDVAAGPQPYVCLCPGNTERITTGDNAFACEKRSRRR